MSPKEMPGEILEPSPLDPEEGSPALEGGFDTGEGAEDLMEDLGLDMDLGYDEMPKDEM